MNFADKQKTNYWNISRSGFSSTSSSNYSYKDKTPKNRKCPKCGCITPIYSDNCLICNYNFNSRKIYKKSHEKNKSEDYKPSSLNNFSENIPVIQENDVHCPNCNKKQNNSNEVCEICGCDLDVLDYDFDNKISLDTILSCGINIPQNKQNLFLNDKYSNSPTFCGSLDDYHSGCVNVIKSKFNKGSVLFVSLNNNMLSKITELLKNDGFGEYINNNSLFKEYYLSIQYESIINDLAKIDEFNNYFMDKFSIKLPNNINSIKEFIGIIKFNDVKYLTDEDLTKLNEFIKIYWEYWKFISSSDIDLSASESYKDFIKQLNTFKDIYVKYFEKPDFDVHVLTLIKRLNMHIFFTELVDKLKIKCITNLGSDLLKDEIDQLEVLINDMESKLEKVYSDKEFLNKPLNEINNDLVQKINAESNIKKKSIILMNIYDALILFDNSDIFDYVIFEDNILINGEARLHLFLISKNKLSSVKLWYK